MHFTFDPSFDLYNRQLQGGTGCQRCATTTRAAVQEKADLQNKLDNAEEHVKDLVTLEVKLQEAIDARRADIGRAELAGGKEYKDDNAGVSIVYAPNVVYCFLSSCLTNMECSGNVCMFNKPCCAYVLAWHSATPRKQTHGLCIVSAAG
jgi:hypothetical protein